MNTTLSILRPSFCGVLALVTSGTLGCAVAHDPVADEDVAATAQALGEASCATATADATFEGGIDYLTFSRAAVHAPAQYSNPHCYKSAVVDVTNYSADFAEDGPAPDGAGTWATWSDFEATSRADCEGQYVRAILYEYRDGPGVTNGFFQVKDVTSYGSWQPFPDPSAPPPPPGSLLVGNPGCTAPSVFFDSMYTGRHYRIAATARSSGLTRMLTIESVEGIGQFPR